VAGEPGEKRRDVVGAAPGETVRQPGPLGDRLPARPQVLLAARDHERGERAAPGLRREVGHVVGRVRREVVHLGDRAGDPGEGGVHGDIVDDLAVDDDRPAVAQRFEVLLAGAHDHALLVIL
jgi:hypothetical protein